MVTTTIRYCCRQLVRFVSVDGGVRHPEHRFPRTCETASDVLAETGSTAEAHIERLLASADGPLEQQAIVEYTGWSAATVSRRLSAMEAEGRITRVRIGRKKLVCLPDAEPEIAT